MWSILQTLIETGLAGALVWAARTLSATQKLLAPRLDLNTQALDRNTAALCGDESRKAS
ncbi:MAG: hypothetical protein ACREJF_02845 [Candidatus Methylomirabilales bacterium]